MPREDDRVDGLQSMNVWALADHGSWKFDGASAAWRAVVEPPGDRVESLRRMNATAFAAYQSGKYDEALAAWRAVIDLGEPVFDALDADGRAQVLCARYNAGAIR